MAAIVLDKCYLQGASPEEVRQLCADHTVLMPEVLLFELLTTKEDARAYCFRKLPEAHNPVELISHVGSLMAFERETHTPASPVDERRANIRFTFSPRLGSGTFVYTQEQKETIAEWEARMSEAVEEFKSRSVATINWFPSIAGYKPGMPPEEIENLRQAVATDHQMILAIYEMIRHDSFPPSSMINERWAYFRWIQVQLLAVLEYIRRYGTDNMRAAFWRVHNDVVDMEYTITGLLAGALASRDSAVQNTFRLLQPSGLLVS
jgi:hypothetical protein